MASALFPTLQPNLACIAQKRAQSNAYLDEYLGRILAALSSQDVTAPLGPLSPSHLMPFRAKRDTDGQILILPQFAINMKATIKGLMTRWEDNKHFGVYVCSGSIKFLVCAALSCVILSLSRSFYSIIMGYLWVQLSLAFLLTLFSSKVAAGMLRMRQLVATGGGADAYLNSG